MVAARSSVAEPHRRDVVHRPHNGLKPFEVATLDPVGLVKVDCWVPNTRTRSRIEPGE
jgi:hypothetical protein